MEDLVWFIELILTKSNFTFNEKHYLQLHGMVMGTRMAPSYANIFMHHLEVRLLNHVDDKPDIWWRYWLIMWSWFGHSMKGVQVGLWDQINHFHPTIKFTAEWSNSSTLILDIRVFLDVMVFLNQGHIATGPFQKPMGTHQHLHQKLPPETLQIFYLIRPGIETPLNVDNMTFWERIKYLKHHLVKWGYRESVVQKQIDWASKMNKNTVLTSSEHGNMHRVPLVYHPKLPNLSKFFVTIFPVSMSPRKWRKWYQMDPLWPTDNLEVWTAFWWEHKYGHRDALYMKRAISVEDTVVNLRTHKDGYRFYKCSNWR